MAWDSSSSSDELLPRRKSSRQNPRQIPRLLLESSSDEELSAPKPLERKDSEIHPKEDFGEENTANPEKAENIPKPSEHQRSDAQTSDPKFQPAESAESDTGRTGWRFKSKAPRDQGNSADRSKSPRSPARRARWNSQAMKQDLTSETKVFDRLYNDFLQKTQADKGTPSQKPKMKDSERQVFNRLYEDALVKREVVAKKREAKEKREEQHLQQLRLQAPEDQVMAMCQRLYDRRKVKETAAQPVAKPQDPTESFENSKKLHSFVHHQAVWNANRVARVEAERLRQLDSERKYLEKNSIHRSLTPVNGCHDRLYKDFDKRAARLEKLRAQQSEDHVAPTSSPRSGVDTAQVSARLHNHFEERKLRLDQKRKEQDDFIRWRSQDPRCLRSRSGSPRTPSTATAVSQTSSSESAWRTRPGTPRGASRCVTPDKSRSPRARSPAPRKVQEVKDVAEVKDGKEREEGPGLRAEVEMNIISARGSRLLEATSESWTCSVEVGEATKPKKCILQTPNSESSTWNFKAQATLFQADVLQFKMCNSSGECVAQTSLSVASILMICYSGFDGELKLQPLQPGPEDDATYLHVAMRVLDVVEPRIAKVALEPEKVAEPQKEEQQMHITRPQPKVQRKVHPHEGYKAKPYAIVAEKAKTSTASSLRSKSLTPRKERSTASSKKTEVSKATSTVEVEQGNGQRMRSISFDRTRRTARTRSAIRDRDKSQPYEFEILIEEPFVTVHIEDRFLPQHLRESAA